jgi:hypothetical protein
VVTCSPLSMSMVCILLSVGGTATVAPIPDERRPEEIGHQALWYWATGLGCSA